MRPATCSRKRWSLLYPQLYHLWRRGKTQAPSPWAHLRMRPMNLRVFPPGGPFALPLSLIQASAHGSPSPPQPAFQTSTTQTALALRPVPTVQVQRIRLPSYTRARTQKGRSGIRVQIHFQTPFPPRTKHDVRRQIHRRTSQNAQEHL